MYDLGYFLFFLIKCVCVCDFPTVCVCMYKILWVGVYMHVCLFEIHYALDVQVYLLMYYYVTDSWLSLSGHIYTFLAFVQLKCTVL